MAMSRLEAIEALERYGIRGVEIYLIDIVPLIEMVWADGEAQPAELAVLDGYLRRHVERVNRTAGYELISSEQAHDFCDRFLRQLPDPELLGFVRSLIPSIRLSNSDSRANERLRQSLLATCLDIASAAVTHYPYGLEERFEPSEKACFFEILEALDAAAAPQP
jgi:hypothetical protein